MSFSSLLRNDGAPWKNLYLHDVDCANLTAATITCPVFETTDLYCSTLTASNVYATDSAITHMSGHRLTLQGGTNDLIIHAPISTGQTTLKYQDVKNVVTQTLPNVTGTVAISGGSQSVSFSTVTGTTGTFTTLTNVNRITGQNGGYIEFEGGLGPPVVRCVAPTGNPWQFGGSDAGNLNRQISCGYYLSIDRGLLYAFDQGTGTGKNLQFGFPGFPVTHYFEGSVLITGNSLNGITIPATGGTFAKLTDIPTPMTQSWINLYYDSYPFNLYTSGTTIAIGTSTSTASNITVSSNEITLPPVSGIWEVNVSVPVYKESAIQLYDGANNPIVGTYLAGGNPTIDAMGSVLAGGFVIAQPAGQKFTLRGAGTTGAYVGKASACTNAVSLHISVRRIN